MSKMIDNQKPLQSQPQTIKAQTFTGVRLNLGSTQSFDETHQKILVALKSADYAPGQFMREWQVEVSAVMAKKDPKALEEFANKKSGFQGFM